MSCKHYWNIHKDVVKREMRNMDDYEWSVIASDAEHVTRQFVNFEKRVEMEAKRIFEDENHFANDPASFAGQR